MSSVKKRVSFLSDHVFSFWINCINCKINLSSDWYQTVVRVQFRFCEVVITFASDMRQHFIHRLLALVSCCYRMLEHYLKELAAVTQSLCLADRDTRTTHIRAITEKKEDIQRKRDTPKISMLVNFSVCACISLFESIYLSMSAFLVIDESIFSLLRFCLTFSLLCFRNG